MPTDYTGTPSATQAPASPPAKGVAPIIRIPNDLEAAAVASIWQALKVLADFSAWLTAHAGIIDAANTWTVLQTLNGPGSDENAAVGYGGTITSIKIWANWGGSGANGRLCLENDGSISLTVNAAWHSSGGNANKWTLDNSAKDALRLKLNGNNGRLEVYTKASGSAAWADGSWSLGTYIAGGAVTAAGQIFGAIIASQAQVSIAGIGGGSTGGLTVAVGDAYRESVDFAGGWFDDAATIGRAMNVSSVVKVVGQTGLYKVTLKGAAPNKILVSSLVLQSQSAAHLQVEQVHPYEPTTTIFYIRCFDMVGNAQDLNPADQVHFTCKAY